MTLLRESRCRALPLPTSTPGAAPHELKGPRICPLSDSFYLDRYERRINPRGVPYFWIQAGEQIEPAKPGTDVDLCSRGYITCTFVGGFSDNNHLFEGMLGRQEG